MSIYVALTNQLKTVTGLPAFAEANEVFRPSNAAWCRATLLPAEPVDGSIGERGFVWDQGLYQVDVFSPLNTRVSETIPNAIIAAFPRALRMAVNGYDHQLEVQRCWLSQTRQDTSWFIQSIMVRYRVPRNLGA